MKINRDNVEKWCVALEGDEYKQGMGKLFNEQNQTYCCLGVAAKIAGMEFSTDYDGIAGDVSTVAYNEIYNWLGIPHFEDENYHTFPMLNDDHGYSFKQIAKVVRSNLLNQPEKEQTDAF